MSLLFTLNPHNCIIILTAQLNPISAQLRLYYWKSANRLIGRIDSYTVIGSKWGMLVMDDIHSG
jgi:hypothetical protein